MGLIQWTASKLGYAKVEPTQRAAVSSPIDIVPTMATVFGPGASHQPSTSTLLSESIGIPDAACRAIANRLGTLVPEVYIERRTKPGTTIDEILDDHPLALLLKRPHPNFSFTQTFRLIGQYVVTVGEAYLLKVSDRLGTPRELHVVPPGAVTPLIRSNVVQAYRVTNANGQWRDYPPDVFVRFFFPDPENPWRSEGLLAPTGITADTHKFAGQHLRYHYQHDATPKTVLEAQENAETWTQDELEAFYERWRQTYSSRGGARMGLPALTPIGYKLVTMLAQSGKDIAPLLENLTDSMLLQYGVPKSVLGQVVSGDRSSAETNQWIFDRYAVLPVAQLVTDGINSQLVPDFNTKIKFRFQTFVSEDKEFKLAQEKQDLELKVRSINMVREDRGLEGVEWGEYPVAQAQDQPYDPNALPEAEEETELEDLTPEEIAHAEKLVHIQVRKQFQKHRRSRRVA